jgi:hypothetical protein
MRFATTLAVAALSVATFGLPGPAYSQGGTPVTAFGLQCTPLGDAGLVFDPLARKLIANNIGSSGQDGVSIELGKSAAGILIGGPFHGGDPDNHRAIMHGVSGSTGAPLSCDVDAHRNADGSLDLVPDFSGVGATGCWVLLLDASGHLVKRVYKPLPFSIHVAASLPFIETSWSMGMGKGMYEWIKASFDHKVLVSVNGGAGGGIECDDVQFAVAGESGGEPFAWMTSAGFMSGVPSPPGQFVISELAIVPPCAGCPNGPDDNDALSAEGGALWVLDGAVTGPLVLGNIGSSGQDGVYRRKCRDGSWSPCGRESPTRLSMGIVLDEQPLAPGLLTCSALGSVGGSDQSLGQLSCFVSADRSEFEPDFSAVGSAGYRVLLYSQGAVVADVTNPLSRASHQKPQTQWLVQADLIGGTGPMEFRIICITSPCPGWTVALNGAVYLVDQIVFQPVGPGVVSPSGIEEMALHAASYGTPTPLLPSTGASLPIYGVESFPLQPVLAAPTTGPVAEIAGAIASPNPASGPMRVVFALPRAGQIDVAVIDAAGRRVRDLASASFTAGAHELTWDGRDDRGSATAPGVYFVRIESGGTARVSRVTRLW